MEIELSDFNIGDRYTIELWNLIAIDFCVKRLPNCSVSISRHHLGSGFFRSGRLNQRLGQEQQQEQQDFIYPIIITREKKYIYIEIIEINRIKLPVYRTVFLVRMHVSSENLTTTGLFTGIVNQSVYCLCQ